MERTNPFSVIAYKAKDITQLYTCDEIMKLDLNEIFANWYKTLSEKTEGYYRKTYVPRLRGMGGIFNKKLGARMFTVEEFNEQDHHAIEFMINHLLTENVPNAKPYLLCYHNLCLYLHGATRGVFKIYKSKI